jgi:hypothetical protein
MATRGRHCYEPSSNKEWLVFHDDDPDYVPGTSEAMLCVNRAGNPRRAR